MGSPSIAHYGTTIIEAAPPAGAVQKDVPKTGDLGATLRLLEIMGFKPLIQNMYEGIGRQYISHRGSQADVDYIEFDAFTSYRAVERPATDAPRVGDTVFRMTDREPRGLFESWRDENLVTVLSNAEGEAAFLDGASDWILLRAPNGQMIELGPTQPTRAENHTIYVWTDPAELERTAAGFADQFGMQEIGRFDFHGQADGVCLRRMLPGITIGLLTPKQGERVEPRWTDDIFLEAGYSHYRLGAPDKTRTLAASRVAFPDGGDVSFVYFHDSYLELVQVSADDPACADELPQAAE
jgi:hypothetical protein